MNPTTHFNVRAYGIWLKDQAVLVSREDYPERSAPILKFPGGGLELGESPVDALKREILEEMNLECEVGDSFFIARRFVKSAFNDSQVISLYFYLDSLNGEIPKGRYPAPERPDCFLEFYFVPLKELKPSLMTFIHEKDVVEKLLRVHS